MDNSSVTYLKTELISIIGDIKLDVRYDHYIYFAPTLKVDAINKTALYDLDFESQFELQVTSPFKLRTKSQFLLENFIVHEERYEILKDYLFFAFRKHLLILKENLSNQKYISEINENLDVFENKNPLVLDPIETMLYLASIDCSLPKQVFNY